MSYGSDGERLESKVRMRVDVGTVAGALPILIKTESDTEEARATRM